MKESVIALKPSHCRLAMIGFGVSFFASFLLSLFSSLLFSSSSFAALYEVKSFDSIAGYGTEIVIENGDANENVKVLVKSPKTSEFSTLESFETVLNAEGKKSFVLDSDKTTVAGIYYFTVIGKNQSYADGQEYSFEIFSDDVSREKSQVFVVDDSVGTGEKAKLTVYLYDKYYNPVANHRIELFSSRDFDRIIVPDTDKTNIHGEISYFITTNRAGESEFRVKDNTGDVVLTDSPTVRFSVLSSGGNNLSADISDDFSRVSRFEMEFPDSVKADSDANYLTLRALDSDGNVVEDFVGSIKIMIPTDSNAVVPGNDGVYTFLEKDQGEILFSRSVIFPEKGKHQLEVYAYDIALDEVNNNIFAKQTITVEEKENSPGESPGTTAEVVIITPSNNSTFSVADISVTGTALENSDVKIMLDENPLLEVAVSSSGQFTALLKNVEEGEHILEVYQKEDSSIISKEISFLVDTKASDIISAEFSPKEALPKDMIEVTLQVEDEDDVNRIEVFWNGTSDDAEKIGKNSYRLLFPAPEKEGEYPIKITLTDTLQNSVSRTLAPSLSVKKNATPAEGIKNLTAVYDIKTKKIKLSWKGLSENPLLYIVESGIAKTSLQKIKSVSGKLSTVELENLAPGKYFFSVSAVNSDGSEGAQSEVIAYEIIIPTPTPTATPTATPEPTVATPKPTDIPTKAPTPLPTIAPNPQLSVNPVALGLQLSWEKGDSDFLKENSDITKYRISYGVSSRSYGKEIEVERYITSTKISDLIPEVQYFVALEAIDSRGAVVFSYDEKTGIPLDSSFHPAPTSPSLPYPQWVAQTGVELFLVLGGFFLFFSAWYLTKKEED